MKAISQALGTFEISSRLQPTFPNYLARIVIECPCSSRTLGWWTGPCLLSSFQTLRALSLPSSVPANAVSMLSSIASTSFMAIPHSFSSPRTYPSGNPRFFTLASYEQDRPFVIHVEHAWLRLAFNVLSPSKHRRGLRRLPDRFSTCHDMPELTNLRLHKKRSRDYRVSFPTPDIVYKKSSHRFLPVAFVLPASAPVASLRNPLSRAMLPGLWDLI
jgi:hypothetical protein